MPIWQLLVRALVIGSVLWATASSAWTPPKSSELRKEDVKEVLWEGATDIEMLAKVRADLDGAKRDKVKVLRVALLSPGGPVIAALEIARLVRAASDNGLVVEIHGSAVVASGGTVVLAAGTPGRRYIARPTLVLVHPPQRGGFGGASCVAWAEDPKTEDDKIGNAILNLLRDSYAALTKRAAVEVEDWLTCGRERAGDGSLAVSLGLADEVE